MATGIVKWFNPTKGYGFIQPQGGGKDVFVHISAVERAGLSTLNESQQVQYEEVANKGKTTAENHVGEVNRMSGAPGAPPWGWLVSSPDQKPNDLDAILRDGAASRELAVELGQGDPNAFESAAANENVPRERTG